MATKHLNFSALFPNTLLDVNPKLNDNATQIIKSLSTLSTNCSAFERELSI